MKNNKDAMQFYHQISVALGMGERKQTNRYIRIYTINQLWDTTSNTFSFELCEKSFMTKAVFSLFKEDCNMINIKKYFS